MKTVVLSCKRFVFPQRNRILLSLTGILSVMILLIIKYCDFPLCLPEKYFGIFVCELDSEIFFEEMSTEEERRYRDKSLTKKIQQIVNS